MGACSAAISQKTSVRCSGRLAGAEMATASEFQRRSPSSPANAVCRVRTVLVLVGLIVLAYALAAESLAAARQSDSIRSVRTIEVGRFGHPNPAGLAYSSRADAFLVVAAPGRAGASTSDMVAFGHSRNTARALRLPAAIPDPINMAFDDVGNRLLVYQPDTGQLIEMDAGGDGIPGAPSFRHVDARHLGLLDPVGMTVDPQTGALFILDAIGPRILRVEPHSALGFEAPSVSEIPLWDSGLEDLQGIAFDPVTGHLHVLSPARQRLYEVTLSGLVVANRDVSQFGIGNPQAMVFAPSGDLTDDPSETSLYIADAGVDRGGLEGRSDGGITELSMAVTAAASTSAQGTLVQVIDASQFSPPSPDTAGATYLSDRGTLLLSDSEVNEMPIFEGVNLFEITLGGAQFVEYTTTSYSDEPTGLAFNPVNGHVFVSDDDADEVFVVNPGPDGFLGTTDDIITSFDTRDFNSTDPEGVTFDPDQGYLYIADGVNNEVYEIDPGANGLFDGVDDQVTSFDTRVLGINDPEGITFDSDNGFLYVIGTPDTVLLHVTTQGDPVRMIDVSEANASKPAGLAYAPSSVNPLEMNVYITERGVDNNSDPNENDGKVYEMSFLAVAPGNTPPVVSAGQDQNVTLPGDATLDGTVSDDGLPDPPAMVTTTWSLLSGPGTVNFADAGAVGTTASFSTAGTYVLRLTADDGDLQRSDDTTFTVTGSGGETTFEVRVSASSDDAEERSNGSVTIASSDLELVFDSGSASSDQTVGMRFNGVAIPKDAEVVNAFVQFQVDETRSTATSLTIRAELVGNSGTFVTSSFNVSSRVAPGQQEVTWSPVPWNTVGEAGFDQRTPDITSVIQEVLNLAEWTSGNSLSIIITGIPGSARVAESFDGVSNAAPLLHVEWIGGGGGGSDTIPPTVTMTSPTEGATISGTSALTADAFDNVAVESVQFRLDSENRCSADTSAPYTCSLNSTLESDGAVTFTAVATDTSGNQTISGPVTVTIDNSGGQAPVADAQTVVTDEDTAVAITLTGSDADGDPLTFAVAGGPSSGVLSGTAPNLTYTPNSGYSGADSFTYTANDGVVDSAPATVSITVNAAAPTIIETLDVRVAASTDDAEERDTGSMYRNSSDLELVFDKGDQTVGMRFNVLIPQAATITNAYVQFKVDEVNSGATFLTIEGEDIDDAVTFSTSKRNISSRPRTTAAVSWSPPPWTTKGEAGPDQRSPDISSVIQEIVTRPGWSSGNSLVIIITGTGERTAESFNGDQAGAPLLHVEYR